MGHTVTVIALSLLAVVNSGAPRKGSRELARPGAVGVRLSAGPAVAGHLICMSVSTSPLFRPEGTAPGCGAVRTRGPLPVHRPSPSTASSRPSSLIVQELPDNTPIPGFLGVPFLR